MSALLISSVAFASGDPQTFPSSRGTIRYGDDVYISANDTNTLNQMLTGYTTNTSEAVEGALVAANGTPYLATLSSQVNNMAQSINQLSTIPEKLDQIVAAQDELAEAIEGIQTSGGGNGSSSVVPEGAVQIVVSYTPEEAKYFTLRYKLNGKDYIALPTTQEASISVFVDKNSNLGVQSTDGVSTQWMLSSADDSFTDHTGDESYVNNNFGTNKTDLVNIPVGQMDGGFSIYHTTSSGSGLIFSRAYRGLYKVSVKKVPSNGAATIHFDANGGSGTMADIADIYYGSTVDLPACTFTRPGYAFMGWSTDPGAGLTGSPNDDRGRATDIPKIVWLEKATQSYTSNGDEEVTYYAIWTDKLIVHIAVSQHFSSSPITASTTANITNGLQELTPKNKTITVTATVDSGEYMGQVTFGGLVTGSTELSLGSHSLSKSFSFSSSKVGAGYLHISADASHGYNGSWRTINSVYISGTGDLKSLN